MCFGAFLLLRAAQRTSEKLVLMIEEKNAEIKFKDGQILELAKAVRTERTRHSAPFTPSLQAGNRLSNSTTEKQGEAPASELLERIKEIEGESTFKDRWLLSLSQAREKLESTIEDLEATVKKLKQELSTSKEAEKHWKEQAWLQASSSGLYKPAVELRKSEERITELEDKLSESHRQINTYRTAVESCRCDSALGGLNFVERQDPEKKLTQTGWVSLPPTLCVFDGPIS